MEQTKQSKLKRDISSEWFHALVESALEGIVIMDDKGRILDVNPAVEKIFGYRSENLVGYPVSEKLIPPSKRKAHEKGLIAFLTTGEKKILAVGLK